MDIQHVKTSELITRKLINSKIEENDQLNLPVYTDMRYCCSIPLAGLGANHDRITLEAFRAEAFTCVGFPGAKKQF